jgi:hypothetical protein
LYGYGSAKDFVTRVASRTYKLRARSARSSRSSSISYRRMRMRIGSKKLLVERLLFQSQKLMAVLKTSVARKALELSNL